MATRWNRAGSALASFRVKLVVYFVLLSLLPLAAAAWGFVSVAGQSETRRVDARLEEGLSAALGAYQARLNAAQIVATALARDRVVQLDLRRHDRAALVALLRGRGNVSVSTPGGFEVGARTGLAATQAATVVTSRDGIVGTVSVAVPLDTSFLERLRDGSGLEAADVVGLVRGRTIVVSAPVLHGVVALAPGPARTLAVGGVRYRTLVAPAFPDPAGVRFVVLSPQKLIDSANAASRDRLLLGLLAALALGSLAAYVEGRSIVRALRKLAEAAHAIARGRFDERVATRGRDEFALLGSAFNDMAAQLEARISELEGERERLREAITRIGEALAATHDVDQLLHVIVEAALEGTGAAYASLRTESGTVVESGGDPQASGERLELPLAAGRQPFGTLVLVGEHFGDEERRTAASLASHAGIALENERLHRVVERQARIDELTGLANRPQCADALKAEVARSERLDTPLTLVLADLDDFRAVNDAHGKDVGDAVLREFAGILRSSMRDADLAGRWGDEEFVLLLPGAQSTGGGALADRIRRALADRSFPGRDGAAVRVTCSFGIAQHDDGKGGDELYAAAEQALLRAKAAGGNRVEADSPIRVFQ